MALFNFKFYPQGTCKIYIILWLSIFLATLNHYHSKLLNFFYTQSFYHMSFSMQNHFGDNHLLCKIISMTLFFYTQLFYHMSFFHVKSFWDNHLSFPWQSFFLYTTILPYVLFSCKIILGIIIYYAQSFQWQPFSIHNHFIICPLHA